MRPSNGSLIHSDYIYAAGDHRRRRFCWRVRGKRALHRRARNDVLQVSSGISGLFVRSDGTRLRLKACLRTLFQSRARKEADVRKQVATA